MHSMEKVINNNLNKSINYIKNRFTKNMSLNIKNFNYRAGNIRHSYKLI